MDASALSMVMERQETIRGAYNQYRHEFQAGPSRGRVRTWAWDRLDERDIQELVETTLDAEWEPQNKEPDAYERKRRDRHRQRVKKWVITYLEDSGSMFRLLRMSEFDTTRALDALRRTITFRIQNRYQLTWSPLPYKSRRSFPASSTRHSVPRSSARMGRASPTPSLATSISTEATSIVGGEDEDGPFLDDDPSHSLIQLYPASSKDAHYWPILTFSASALHLVAPSTGGWTSYLWSNSTTDAGDTEQRLLSPKEQVLASYERVRRYMSRLGDEEDVPLQFVLIIDLAGANINTTAFDLLNCFVGELASQFHGMCAVVFVVNYTWEFNALWAFVRRLLPSTTQSRIFFPSTDDLVGYFGSEALPPALGGVRLQQVPFDRPVFKTHVHTNTGHEQEPTVTNGEASNQNGSTGTIGEQISTDEKAATVPISRTSSQNPFFGYPSVWSWSASSGPGRPAHSLEHDRRRKRDLVRTLLWLFLLRSQARLASLLRFLSRVLLGSRSARWTRRLPRVLALVVALVVGWIAKHELAVNSMVSIDWNALTAS